MTRYLEGRTITPALVWIAAIWIIGFHPPTAQGQARSGNPEVRQLLDEFRNRCRTLNVERGGGSSVYHVYAWADMETRLDPTQGVLPQVFAVTRVCVLGSDEDLTTLQKGYQRLKQAFARYGGDVQYRQFRFEDKSWRFDGYDKALAKAVEVRRKSAMTWWPEVLSLAVRARTEASEYYVFGYRPIDVRVSFSERELGEDEADPTYLANVGPGEAVIFDDKDAAAAAAKQYAEFVACWAGINDGRGTPVGRIQPVTERFSTFAEAKARATELGWR